MNELRGLKPGETQAAARTISLSPSDGERAGVRGKRRNPVDQARQLRKKATWAEKTLWRILRNERLAGYKFRRQHPLGAYSLDFYCAEARLAVETDGLGHGHPERQKRDAARDAFLQAQGILVKRIWNSQLRREPEVVRENLWRLLQKRAPHPGNVKPARRVTSRVLNPDRPTGQTPHPALSPSDGERVKASPQNPCASA
jgi:very-short-patch-repair endonuclease